MEETANMRLYRKTLKIIHKVAFLHRQKTGKRLSMAGYVHELVEKENKKAKV